MSDACAGKLVTTDELLTKMASVLHMDGVWHARATDSGAFSKGATARAAMLSALGMSEVGLNDDLF